MNRTDITIWVPDALMVEIKAEARAHRNTAENTIIALVREALTARAPRMPQGNPGGGTD